MTNNRKSTGRNQSLIVIPLQTVRLRASYCRINMCLLKTFVVLLTCCRASATSTTEGSWRKERWPARCRRPSTTFATREEPTLLPSSTPVDFFLASAVAAVAVPVSEPVCFSSSPLRMTAPKANRRPNSESEASCGERERERQEQVGSGKSCKGLRYCTLHQCASIHVHSSIHWQVSTCPKPASQW